MPSRSARLDPRAPFVLDTRELGRRPGSMRRVRLSLPAPDTWALELVRVPAGSEVDLELRLEAVMDGVLVSGTARVDVATECGRCLQPVEESLDVDLQELFAYDPDPEDDASALVGDLLDLEPLLRDTVVLALPLNPVCAEDCGGLCPGCGELTADLPADHSHDEIDPRWASLAALQPADSGSARPADSYQPETGS